MFLTEPGADPDRAVTRAGGTPLLPRFGWPTIVGPTERVRAHLQSLVDAGIDYVIVYLPRLAYDREPLHRFAREVIPHFA